MPLFSFSPTTSGGLSSGPWLCVWRVRTPMCCDVCDAWRTPGCDRGPVLQALCARLPVPCWQSSPWQPLRPAWQVPQHYTQHYLTYTHTRTHTYLHTQAVHAVHSLSQTQGYSSGIPSTCSLHLLTVTGTNRYSLTLSQIYTLYTVYSDSQRTLYTITNCNRYTHTHTINTKTQWILNQHSSKWLIWKGAMSVHPTD